MGGELRNGTEHGKYCRVSGLGFDQEGVGDKGLSLLK